MENASVVKCGGVSKRQMEKKGNYMRNGCIQVVEGSGKLIERKRNVCKRIVRRANREDKLRWGRKLHEAFCKK